MIIASLIVAFVGAMMCLFGYMLVDDALMKWNPHAFNTERRREIVFGVVAFVLGILIILGGFAIG